MIEKPATEPRPDPGTIGADLAIHAPAVSPTLKRALAASLLLHTLLLGMVPHWRRASPVPAPMLEPNVSIAVTVDDMAPAPTATVLTDVPAAAATPAAIVAPVNTAPVTPPQPVIAPTPVTGAASDIQNGDTARPVASVGVSLPGAPTGPAAIPVPETQPPPALLASPRPPATPARPLYRVNPEPPYPATARRRRQEGLVILRLHVTAEGRAAHLQVAQSSGFQSLDEAALVALKSWEFEPARIGAAPVSSEIEVPVRFKLTP